MGNAIFWFGFARVTEVRHMYSKLHSIILYNLTLPHRVCFMSKINIMHLHAEIVSKYTGEK